MLENLDNDVKGVHTPFLKMKANSFVVKVASRCNLNCTYCYVYNKGDLSYKLQPKFMSKSTIENLFWSLVKTYKITGQNKVLIIFHGGEPLLAGIEFYRNFIKTGINIVADKIKIDYALQTNGVLLTEDYCEELKKIGIQVGISVDGTKSSNEKNRIFHNNKSAYDDILRGFNVIKKVFGNEFANCLCVIDTSEPAQNAYNHFKKIGANEVHFLFPDYNYNDATVETVPKIGDWLIDLFDLWFNDLSSSKPNIRPLYDLIGLICAFDQHSEIFGKGKNDTLVIETNGNIETVDTLKICGNGFTKTKLNVEKDNIDYIYEKSELARLYYNSHDNLCEQCKACPLENICGGGFLAHRYSSVNQFDNPSIYCFEITKLICHIQNKLLDTLTTEKRLESGLDYISIEEILTLR